MRIGLIGVGRTGAFHARTLTDLPAVDEIIITDAVSDVARRVGERFDVRVVPEPADMLGRQRHSDRPGHRGPDHPASAFGSLVHKSLTLIEPGWPRTAEDLPCSIALTPAMASQTPTTPPLPTGCTGCRHRMARPDAAPEVMPSCHRSRHAESSGIETLAVTFSHWTGPRRSENGLKIISVRLSFVVSSAAGPASPARWAWAVDRSCRR